KQQLELKLKQEEEDRKQQAELKLKQEERIKREKQQAELKVLEEKKQVEKAKKEFINDIKNDFKKELNKDKLLKKYIKTNENLKKSRYTHNNKFSFVKACLIVCFLLIGYSFYNSYIVNGGQVPIWVSEINNKFEGIKYIILN
ncbi:MAG: hypothetical protein RSG52_12995, partial [Terrisporobacter sp.]|uniref:hypothetical protein n=1 Tax=Terrisporobacter sp. TaxID=1965305 RepID=UPI002FCC49ED